MRKSFFVGLFALSAFVMADASISSASFQEKKIGKETKWVKATKVVPGTKVRYVNTVSNNGSEIATNLVITNAVPKHMNYVGSSAKCGKQCSILYSIDGKNFDLPANLTVVDKGKKRVALPSEYSAIRWTIAQLSGKQKDTVQYDAILE